MTASTHFATLQGPPAPRRASGQRAAAPTIRREDVPGRVGGELQRLPAREEQLDSGTWPVGL